MKNERKLNEGTRMYLEFLVHALFAVLGAIVVATAASASPGQGASSIDAAGELRSPLTASYARAPQVPMAHVSR